MESTSYISDVSYVVEEKYLNNDKVAIAKIAGEYGKKLLTAKTNHPLPPQLTYIYSHYDDISGVTGVAFYDSERKSVIIGYTGSNELEQDWIDADAFGILLGQGHHYQKAFEFYEEVQSILKGKPINKESREGLDFIKSLPNHEEILSSSISTLTGHSLGGNIAQRVALRYNKEAIVYNSAPLYVDFSNVILDGLLNEISMRVAETYTNFFTDTKLNYQSLKQVREDMKAAYYANVKSIKSDLNRYTNDVIRIRAKDDYLNWVANIGMAHYHGNEYVIDAAGIHHSAPFLEDSAQQIIKGVVNKETRKLYPTADRLNIVLTETVEVLEEIPTAVLQSIFYTVFKGANKVLGYDEYRDAALEKILKSLTDFNPLSPITQETNDGDDRIFGNPIGNDVIDGLGGNDYISGLGGDDFLLGNKGKDILLGDDGNDRLEGGADNDVLYGGNGNDALFGDDGDDTLYGENGNDYLFGGSGNDILWGGDGRDELYGNSGDDILNGGKGSDYLDGGTGDDWLYDSEGDDTFIYKRGYGNDVIYDDKGLNTVRLPDLNPNDIEGTITKAGEAALRVKSHQEYLIFRNFINDRKFRSFILSFGDKKQTKNVYEIHLERDRDSPFRNLVGTDGDDKYTAFLKGTTIRGKGGNDELRGSSGSDRLFGDEGDDHLYGNAGNDFLDGGAGNDRLEGGEGDDTYLFGYGAGQDVMNDGYGLNTIQFTAGLSATDMYVMTLRRGHVRIHLDKSDDTLNIEHFRDYSDELWGGITPSAMRRNIELLFADGKRMAVSDADSPFRRVQGDDQNNTLYALFSSGRNHLSGLGGDDYLSGSDGDDTLEGGEGKDWLEGGAGNDILDGGPGNDKLRGGLGDDTYIFGYGSGQDEVEDYQGQNAISFKAGVTKDKVYVRTFEYGDVAVRLEGSEDSLLIDKYMDFYNRWDGSFSTVRTNRHMPLIFADGTRLIATDDDSPFRLVKGTDQDDFYLTVVFSDGENTLYGLAGNDRLSGKSGNDRLYGADGDDSLYGEEGDDHLYGGLGNDILDGGPGKDWLKGEEGDDTYLFNIGNGIDTIEDKHGQSRILFGQGIVPEAIHAKLGTYYNIILENSRTGDQLVLYRYREGKEYQNFILEFSDGRQFDKDSDDSPLRRLYGTVGDDYLSAYHTSMTIKAGDGADQIFASHGDDYLYGENGNDIIHGNSGNDMLEGGPGDDNLYGGEGDDIYHFNVGDGNDQILDKQGQNILSFDQGIYLSDLRVYRKDDGYSYVLESSRTNNKISLINFTRGKEYRQFSLKFADG